MSEGRDDIGDGPRPIFDALVRPPTMFGCHPVLFAGVAMLSGIVAYAAFLRLSIWLAGLAGLLFAAGVVGGNELHKKDPHILSIWWRSLRYAREYDARPRLGSPTPKQRSWR